MSVPIQRTGKRTAAMFIGIAWFLILLNLGAMVLAVGGPIYLRIAPEDVLFSLPDGVAMARLIVIAQFAFVVITTLQIWLTPRISCLMVADSEETASAERVLRVAQWFAIVALVLTLVSLVLTTRTFRTWSDINQVMQGQG